MQRKEHAFFLGGLDLACKECLQRRCVHNRRVDDFMLLHRDGLSQHGDVASRIRVFDAQVAGVSNDDGLFA